MPLHVAPLVLFVAALLTVPVAAGQTDPVLAELDSYWAEVSRTVAEGDFEGMKATYHPDAVHVAGDAERYETRPMTESLAGDEADIAEERAGLTERGVEFRFSSRVHDSTTAHEVGVAHFWVTRNNQARQDFYWRVDSYLVKKDRWMVILEIQREDATKAEWDRLK